MEALIVERTSHAPRLFRMWCGLAILAIACSACESVLGTDQAAFADEARVVVEGEGAPGMHMVTSTNFIAITNIDTGELEIDQLLASDTAAASTLPFERVYTIRGADRFVVRLVSPDIDMTASIHIRVFLDERLVFNQQATMRDASLQYIAFYQPVF